MSIVDPNKIIFVFFFRNVDKFFGFLVVCAELVENFSSRRIGELFFCFHIPNDIFADFLLLEEKTPKKLFYFGLILILRFLTCFSEENC